MIKKLTYSFLLILCFTGIKATHNRAGEITYKCLGGLTYSITLVTYTGDGPTIADRCKLTIHFGDGDSCVAYRQNGFSDSNSECGNLSKLGVILKPNFKENVYSCVHTYLGYGEFKIWMFDRNRNSGVENVPNSVDQPFYLETLLKTNQFGGCNNSPVLTVKPLDEACFGRCFYHNPGAVDPDGDSLSYELTPCRGEDGITSQIGVPINGYTYPYPGAAGTFAIDPRTGTLTWCVPQKNGEYNVAFYIKEWRKNLDGEWELMGYVMRDMQILVSNCSNNPPSIAALVDTCVVAGSPIIKTFYATDPNIQQVVTLSATGAPFIGNPPFASFPTVSGTITSSTGVVSGSFTWQTACVHVRQSPYQVTIKAEDNDNTVALVDFKTYNITVIGPPPLNLTAQPLGTSIKLTWNKSACNNIGFGNKVNFYRVYRKNNCDPWTPNPCETGVPPSSGFTYIGQTTTINDTTFTDTNNGVGLAHGVSYSYLVVAVYADASVSKASNQVCAQLKRDVPIITNADVLATSNSAGQIFVRWTKPIVNIANLDTTILPGPYEFRLSAKQGVNGNFSQVYTVNEPYYAALNKLTDTTFTHSGINTVSDLWIYKLDFYSNNVFVGSAQTASSVFLSLTPADRKVTLNWTHFVPWVNYMYYIYRKAPSQSSFTLLDSTTAVTYKDTGDVVNRATYCYYILSKGQYSDPTILRPLLNNSEEACTIPKDLTLPCSPTLAIAADCQTGFVELRWNNPNHGCSDDIIKYFLYFKPTEEDPMTLLDSVDVLTDTVYIFDGLESIAGCYAVTSLDSSRNQSIMPEPTCVDNCPEFELPNVVTMNGDGVNDFFKAIKVKHIKDIDLYVFNRWGQVVYHTTDPYFNWDGKVEQTKMLCSEGTYFYTCLVNEKRVKATKPRQLKGFVQVFHK